MQRPGTISNVKFKQLLNKNFFEFLMQRPGTFSFSSLKILLSFWLFCLEINFVNFFPLPGAILIEKDL